MLEIQRTLRTLSLALAFSPLAAQATPLHLYDVNFDGSPTQAGWTAVNLSNINNVTFSAVGNLFLDTRDRGALNTDDAGDTANNDMWRDFIFADERLPASNDPNPAVVAPAGMDITISGLLANTLYAAQVWAFDEVSSQLRTALWNGVSYSFDNSQPDPASLNDHVVRFLVKTDANGVGVLQGRVDFANQGPCCNVFVNGFSLQEVPEPGTLALAGLGIAGVATRRVRRKLATPT